MPETTLAGTRIRERRIHLGLRQAALAKAVGISASYLNLIEHNRRRIGGKLVVELARVLNVEPSLLSEGARTELIDGVRAAVLTGDGDEGLAEAAVGFAEREPGWASFLITQHQRISAQTDLIATLTDRLAHDPQLAASVHEVLSVITAIRSTAGILAGNEPLEKDWLTRFHRNIYEDSQRLADSAQALVAYLEEAEDDEELTETPLAVEELETWLESRDYNIAELEQSDGADHGHVDLGALARDAGVSYDTLHPFLDRYQRDATAIPMAQLTSLLAGRPLIDPLEIARQFDCPLSVVLRRIATMPEGQGPECGLVLCDSSGTVTFRRMIEGFPIPRFGAGCPLWPLYQSLTQPHQPIRTEVRQAGYDGKDFTAFAVSESRLAPSFGGPRVFEATMLILPSRLFGVVNDDNRLPIGASCRICPREDCLARREPSVLSRSRQAEP